GRQDVGIARPARECFAEDGFRRPATVDIRGVDEIDPQFKGAIYAGDRLVFLDADAIGEPRAQGNLRDIQVACSELAVFHGVLQVSVSGLEIAAGKVNAGSASGGVS